MVVNSWNERVCKIITEPPITTTTTTKKEIQSERYHYQRTFQSNKVLKYYRTMFIDENSTINQDIVALNLNAVKNMH